MDTSKYAALFLVESREHLRSCDRLLLAWERDPGAFGQVDGIFRAFHTIKGMAATMGYAGVADLAHHAEDLLATLRAGRATVDEGMFQLLFRTVDLLGSWVETAGAGGDEPGDAGPLLQALAEAGARAGASERTSPGGSPPPLGRRITDRRADRAVVVTIRGDAAMRGARATLALKRVGAFGAVSGLRPPAPELEHDGFDGHFSFRLQSEADDSVIADAIRAAGEVDSVRLGEVGAEPDTAAASLGPGRQIRVELRRLDLLMQQVGELVLARNQLVELAARAGDPDLTALSERIARLVSASQAELIEARLTPVGEVFERFPRLVRDLARELGKQVRFETEGEEIELDRSVLDEVSDPLLHLLRNAIDHGIEPPEERVARGKQGEGRIVLSATRERNTVALRVTDDGAGIDRARILAKAQREGVIGAEVDTLSDDLLLRTVARAGFSTAQEVSGVSGRGVGVDVAMTRMRSIGGVLELQSTEGQGTTFTLRVPLTLAVVRALVAGVGAERYAVPLAYVAETVEFDSRVTVGDGGREAVVVRDRVIPTLHLRDVVSAPEIGTSGRRPAIILEVGERRTALVADTLWGQQEVMVVPFDAPRGMPLYLGGATILADGLPALIIDAAALV